MKGIGLLAPHAAPPDLPAARDRREKVASDFEAMLLGELLRPVLESTGGGAGPLGFEGPFGSLLVEQYAGLIAARGGLGLQQAVLEVIGGPERPAAHPLRAGEAPR